MSGLEPETGPDGRVRPKYGEYATPEEQRARIRQPDAVVLPAPATPPVAPIVSPGAASRRGRPRTWDRVLTVALLCYGLFTVFSSIPTATNYASFASTFLEIFGVTQSLADPSVGAAWGLAAALVLGIGWIAAFGLSWLSLRAGRVTFWIPLVVGIVCNVASSILLMVPLMTDQAVWAALQDAVVGQPR